jgi:hypothetical protein
MQSASLIPWLVNVKEMVSLLSEEDQMRAASKVSGRTCYRVFGFRYFLNCSQFPIFERRCFVPSDNRSALRGSGDHGYSVIDQTTILVLTIRMMPQAPERAKSLIDPWTAKMNTINFVVLWGFPSYEVIWW